MGVSDIAHELNFLFFNDFAALTPTPLPKGLEQLAQRQALLAKQERGAYPPNCKQPLGSVCNLNPPLLRSGGGAGRGCEKPRSDRIQNELQTAPRGCLPFSREAL